MLQNLFCLLQQLPPVAGLQITCFSLPPYWSAKKGKQRWAGWKTSFHEREFKKDSDWVRPLTIWERIRIIVALGTILTDDGVIWHYGSFSPILSHFFTTKANWIAIHAVFALINGPLGIIHTFPLRGSSKNNPLVPDINYNLCMYNNT
jgi:hypothetical protein